MNTVTHLKTTAKSASRERADRRRAAAERSRIASAEAKAKVQAEEAKRSANAMFWQRCTGAATGAIAAALTGMSLIHQKHGIGLVTGVGDTEQLLMAVGIDLGFMAAEASAIFATAGVRDKIWVYSQATVVGSMILSAGFNAVAFASVPAMAGNYLSATGGILLGFATPAMIYALARITFALLTSDK